MVSTRRKKYEKETRVNLLDLPDEILIKILGHLTFDHAASLRPVSINKENIINIFLL